MQNIWPSYPPENQPPVLDSVCVCPLRQVVATKSIQTVYQGYQKGSNATKTDMGQGQMLQAGKSCRRQKSQSGEESKIKPGLEQIGGESPEDHPG
jgi:hypothetical protein